jgi:hypothetical protein
VKSRDESMQVAIHMCMEAMIGFSLDSYFYLKLAKTLSFLLSLMFLFNKIREQEGRIVSVWKRGV